MLLTRPDTDARVKYGKLTTLLSPAPHPVYGKRASMAVYTVNETSGRLEITAVDSGKLVFDGHMENYFRDIVTIAEVTDSAANDGTHSIDSITYDPDTGTTTIEITPPWTGAADGDLIVPKWEPTGETITVVARLTQNVGNAFCVAVLDDFDEWNVIFLDSCT